MAQYDLKMRKSRLMIQFYDITKFWSQSTEKLNHPSLALDEISKKLFSMEDMYEGGRNISTNNYNMLRSQVISNFSQIIQDLSCVLIKGQSKNLRIKNP